MARRTVLWGPDHVELGEVAVRDAAEGVALALTRGLQPKSYGYLDPNEDVAAVSVGDRAALLVVADGHNGAEASTVAVRTVLDRLGDDPPPADLDDPDLVRLFHAAGQAVRSATAGLGRVRRESRTTLTLALLAGRRLQWASLGDSALFLVGAGGGRELTSPEPRFVGPSLTTGAIDRLLGRGTVEVGHGDWVVLVTDGFTNFVRGAVPADAAAAVLRDLHDAGEAVRGLVDLAGGGGAGDNVAVVAVAPHSVRGAPPG